MANQLSDFDFHVLSMFTGSMTVREIAFAMDVEPRDIETAFSRLVKHFGVKVIDEVPEKAVQAEIISLDL